MNKKTYNLESVQSRRLTRSQIRTPSGIVLDLQRGGSRNTKGLGADALSDKAYERATGKTERVSGVVRRLPKKSGKKKGVKKKKKLTASDKMKLSSHSKHHTKKHMREMRKLMQAGHSFKASHAKAMKTVGK